MASVQLLAGIGKRKVTRNGPIDAIDIATSRYTQGIKAQFDQIIANYQQVVNGLVNLTPDILMDALEPTFELSQKYVPVKTGELKASGHLEQDQIGTVTRVLLGYGRHGVPPYAALVHERVDIQHAEPTRAKFLSSALEEDGPNIQRRIVDAYRRLAGTT